MWCVKGRRPERIHAPPLCGPVVSCASAKGRTGQCGWGWGWGGANTQHILRKEKKINHKTPFKVQWYNFRVCARKWHRRQTARFIPDVCATMILVTKDLICMSRFDHDGTNYLKAWVNIRRALIVQPYDGLNKDVLREKRLNLCAFHPHRTHSAHYVTQASVDKALKLNWGQLICTV